MANGRLGVSDIPATTNTSVYSCPATSGGAVVSVSLVNRTTGAIKVRVAVVDGVVGDLAVEDYIEYDALLPAKGTLERTQIAMSAGECIVVYAAAVGVTARVHGYEE